MRYVLGRYLHNMYLFIIIWRLRYVLSTLKYIYIIRNILLFLSFYMKIEGKGMNFRIKWRSRFFHFISFYYNILNYSTNNKLIMCSWLVWKCVLGSNLTIRPWFIQLWFWECINVKLATHRIKGGRNLGNGRCLEFYL